MLAQDGLVVVAAAAAARLVRTAVKNSRMLMAV
jgi:hypothetical protein